MPDALQAVPAVCGGLRPSLARWEPCPPGFRTSGPQRAERDHQLWLTTRLAMAPPRDAIAQDAVTLDCVGSTLRSPPSRGFVRRPRRGSTARGEGLVETLRARETIEAVLGQASKDRCLQIAGYVRTTGCEWGRRLLQVRDQSLHCRGIHEGRMSAQREVGERTHAVDVAPCVQILVARGLLRRHASRCAGDRRVLCQAVAIGFGQGLHQTEIEELNHIVLAATLTHVNVARLYIPVQQPDRVGFSQRRPPNCWTEPVQNTAAISAANVAAMAERKMSRRRTRSACSSRGSCAPDVRTITARRRFASGVVARHVNISPESR